MAESNDSIQQAQNVTDTELTEQSEVSVSSLSRAFSTIDDAPSEITGTSAYTLGRAPYLDGIEPEPRSMLPGYDSTIITLMLGLFVFVAVNFKHYSVFLKSIVQDLINVRRRQNVFNDNTINETRLLLSLISVVCFSEAVLVFSFIYHRSPSLPVVPLMITVLGVSLVYYVVQLIAYSTVGNVFTSRGNAEQWVRGFNASQSVLGIVLILPALVTLFYPGLTSLMFAIGVIFYISARIIFICKGFKIFYHNLFSLVYFILYLCTLEIAPLLLFFRGGELISSL